MALGTGFSRLLRKLGIVPDRKDQELKSPIPEEDRIKPGEEDMVTINIPDEDPLVDRLKAGFDKFAQKAGRDVPIATKSAELAKLGKQMPEGSEVVPAALTLKESGGLSNPAAESMRQANNPMGLMYKGDLVQYPDLTTALLGGNGRQGLQGTLLESGYYDKFLESGDLADFLKVYTPPGGANPSLSTQIQQLQQLMDLFK